MDKNMEKLLDKIQDLNDDNRKIYENAKSKFVAKEA